MVGLGGLEPPTKRLSAAMLSAFKHFGSSVAEWGHSGRQKGLAFGREWSGTVVKSGAPRGAPRSCPAGFVADAVSLPQIKFERIDGVILRGTVWQLCCRLPGLLAEPVHPCSATSVCELHCNISDTIRAGGEDAARQTQLHSPSNPA